MGAGFAILGIMGLGLGVLALAGGGKKKKDAVSPGMPQIPEPGEPATQEGRNWRQWITDQVMQAAQTASPSIVEGAADLIESNIASMPADIRPYAKQAVTALRAQAASLRVDTGATIPPNRPLPPVSSPPVQPEPRVPPKPPQPDPSTGQTDWERWITERVTRGAMSGAQHTMLSLADEIEAAIPRMPRDYQSRAREAVNALRDMAESMNVPPPVQAEPPPPIQDAPPVPQPDPVMSAKRRLAERMTANLKQNGGPPNNRYKEDKELVREYQFQEGLTTDGLYGVGTGLTVVKYGIVPARPYYFSRDPAKTRRDKAEWKRVMQEMAASDPARASEWRAAANVDAL